jgi:uncharacterized membrane protein
VIVHTADGKVKFEESADPSGKKWAKRGAIAGGVVGLIFPPSIILSAAVGGGAGGLWGKIRDKGFKDEDLKEIGNSLPPGSSAIIAVAEDRMVEQLERALGGYEKIAKHAVSAEAAAAIVAEIDDSEIDDSEIDDSEIDDSAVDASGVDDSGVGTSKGDASE